ncbi:MAG: PhoPQ-activated protein PqaA family protein [Verrucomicrobiales bacterium]
MRNLTMAMILTRNAGRWLASAVVLGGLVGRSAIAQTTALDDFVYAADPEVGYEVVGVDDNFLYTRYDLQLTSGSWRSEEEVDRVLWTHWISLWVPDRITASTALLVISGGSNEGTPDFEALDGSLGPASVFSGSVIVDLGQVPNQPIQFAGESEGRSEDALIAHSWAQFLDDPSDSSWPAQLPMTRAAVVAMDAVQDHLSVVEPAHPISDFIVAGASKRGWTAWLTAAAENGPSGKKRVSAVIPIVIDTLNLEASFTHHYQVYGFWAPAVGDYVASGIMDQVGTPEAEALFALVDPYAYRDRLTMPKIIFNSTGDQFFLPDSSKFYLDDLPGDAWLRYLPNTDHSLSQLSDPVEEIFPVYGVLLDQGSSAVPDYTWAVDDDGTLELVTSEAGTSAKLWQATNENTRDFRYDQIGAAYHSTDLVDQGGGVYRASVEAPELGWTAYFIEVEFADGTAATTGVQLVAKEVESKLWIESVEEGMALSFPSTSGRVYELFSGETLDDLSFVEAVLPDGDVTRWIDPTSEAPRKFYQLRVVEP